MALAGNAAEDAMSWDDVEEATELLQEGRYPDALVELREVLRKNPRNAYAFHYLGVAFHETAQHEAARDAFRAALRLSPDYLGARVALAHELRILGDAKAALVAANEALRRFPKDPDALHAAGLAHAAAGNRPAARKQLARFLETNPEVEVAAEVKGILEMLGIANDDEPLDVE